MSDLEQPYWEEFIVSCFCYGSAFIFRDIYSSFAKQRLINLTILHDCNYKDNLIVDKT